MEVLLDLLQPGRTQAALFELPLVAASVAAAAAAVRRPAPPGAWYFCVLALPLAAAAAAGAVRFSVDKNADWAITLHTGLSQLVQSGGMWGLLFGTVSVLSRRATPPSYALVAGAVSAYVLLFRGSPRAVHAPVFIGTVLTAMPNYWAHANYHGQACARALLLCVLCFGAGTAVKGANEAAWEKRRFEAFGDLPLSTADVLHLTLAAAMLSLRRAIQEARCMPQLHAE